jgi:hypothetical protein
MLRSKTKSSFTRPDKLEQPFATTNTCTVCATNGALNQTEICLHRQGNLQSEPKYVFMHPDHRASVPLELPQHKQEDA